MHVQLQGRKSIRYAGGRIRRYEVRDLPANVVQSVPDGVFETDPKKFKTVPTRFDPRLQVITTDVKRDDRALVEEIDDERLSADVPQGPSESVASEGRHGGQAPDGAVAKDHGNQPRHPRHHHHTRARSR